MAHKALAAGCNLDKEQPPPRKKACKGGRGGGCKELEDICSGHLSFCI